MTEKFNNLKLDKWYALCAFYQTVNFGQLSVVVYDTIKNGLPYTKIDFINNVKSKYIASEHDNPPHLHSATTALVNDIWVN